MTDHGLEYQREYDPDVRTCIARDCSRGPFVRVVYEALAGPHKTITRRYLELMAEWPGTGLSFHAGCHFRVTYLVCIDHHDSAARKWIHALYGGFSLVDDRYDERAIPVEADLILDGWKRDEAGLWWKHHEDGSATSLNLEEMAAAARETGG